MKKILKISAIIFLVLFGVLLILPFAFKNQIKAIAEKQIDKKIDAKVRFSGVHLSFIRNFPNISAGLEGVKIIGKGEFSKDTLIAANRFRAVVDIMSIIKGETYKINKIILDKPVIHAIVHPNGKANWDIYLSEPDTAKGKDQSTSFSMNLQSYEINGANIKYEDETLPVKVNVKDFTHKGEGNFTENIYDLITTSSAQEVSINYDGISYLNKNKLNAKVNLNVDNKKSTYKFLENEILLNDLPVKFSGTIAMPDTNILLDLIFNCPNAEVKQLFSLVPAIYKKGYETLKSEGKLSFSGIVRGVYNAVTYPAFDVKLNVANGKIQYSGLPSAVSAINIDMNVANPAGNDFNKILFDIRKFQAKMGSNPVNIEGKINGLSPVTMNAVVKAKLNLEELTQIFPIEGSELKGDFGVDATLNGVYDTLKKSFPKVNAQINMDKGFVKNKEYPVVLENINFNGTLINTNGDLASTLLDLSNFHFDLDKKPFDGKVKVSNFDTPNYDGMVKGSVDLDKLTQIYPVEGMKLSGLFNIDGIANGIYDAKSNALPKMNAKMSMTNGYVKNEEYKVELKNLNFNGTLINSTGTMAAAMLNLPQLHFEMDNEPIDAKVIINNFDNPVFDISCNGGLDLGKIMKIYPVEGLNLDGKVKINQFSTKGSMEEVRNEKYAQTNTKGSVQLQNIHYESKDLGYPVHIPSGNLNFNTQKLDLSAIYGTIGKTDFMLNGSLTNYLAYALFENEPLGGDLTIQCKKLNLNEWMGADDPSAVSEQSAIAPSSNEMSVIEVPSGYRMNINTSAQEVIYDNLILKNFSGKIGIEEKALNLKNVLFETLGGKFAVNGIYDTKNAKSPSYGIDLDIKDLAFKQAFKYFNSFRKLAPIAEFLDGKFNTQLQFMGVMNQKMMPVLENIAGLGIFELLNGKLTGSPITNRLSEVTKIADFKEINLQKASSKFVIKDGWLEVAPFDVKTKDINLNVGGKQALSGNIDYLVKVDAPLGKGGEAAQKALSTLTGGAIQNTGRLKVDLKLGGTAQNPIITGINGGTTADIKDQAIDLAKDKAEDLIKDKTGVDVPLNKDSLKNKIEDKKDEIINQAKDKAEELKNKAEEEAKKKEEEIRKKLEEERRKKEEEIRKKAEEAKKRTEDSIKKALDKLKGNLGIPKWK